MFAPPLPLVSSNHTVPKGRKRQVCYSLYSLNINLLSELFIPTFPYFWLHILGHHNGGVPLKDFFPK